MNRCALSRAELEVERYDHSALRLLGNINMYRLSTLEYREIGKEGGKEGGRERERMNLYGMATSISNQLQQKSNPLVIKLFISKISSFACARFECELYAYEERESIKQIDRVIYVEVAEI